MKHIPNSKLSIGMDANLFIHSGEIMLGHPSIHERRMIGAISLQLDVKYPVGSIKFYRWAEEKWSMIGRRTILRYVYVCCELYNDNNNNNIIIN